MSGAQSNSSEYVRPEAVVVGAGIVGSVQALLLSRAGFNVTIVDSAAVAQHPAVEPSLSVRSVAMSYRSQQLLESVGCWNPDAANPIYSVLVNEQGRFGAVRINAEELSVPALGYVVRNSELEAFLGEQVDANPNITRLQPATAELLYFDQETATVRATQKSDAKTIEAKLLIAADGTQSVLREQLGIECTIKDYQQAAVVTNICCQRDHHNMAFERFTPTGPLALLPLGPRTMSVVFTIASDQVQSVQAMSDERLINELQSRFGGRLGRLQGIGRRAVLPLKQMLALRQTKECCLLIGNSARTLHPVAGQGLNLALRDAFEVAGLLSANKNMADALNVADALAMFSGRRKRDQQFVVNQTDMLARVFKRQSWPISVPLNMLKLSSMLVLDTVTPVRTSFSKQNAGLDIPLTHL